MRLLLGACAVLTLCGCELLQQAGMPLLPSIEYKTADLVKSPSQRMMEAYYCPEVVPDPFGIPGSADTACAVAFGNPPSESQMEVGFRTGYTVSNPNAFPIPVAELLTAVTVFPDQTKQNLGAACVVFCAEGDTSCTGEAGPGNCQASESDLRSAEDFASATANLLIAQGVQYAAGGRPGFEMPQMLPEGDTPLNALFAFGPNPLLKTLEQLALQSVDQLSDGESVTFAVPFRIEGTVWLDVGSLGRAAVGFGPVEGTWIIPTDKLTPDFE